MLKIKLLILALLLAGTTTAYAIKSQPEPVQQIETRTETEQPKQVEEVKEPEEVVEPEPVVATPIISTPEPAPEPTPEPVVAKPTVEELKAYAKPRVEAIPNLMDSKYYAVLCFNFIAENQFRWNLSYADIDQMVAVMTESRHPCGHKYVFMNSGDYIYRGE